MELQLAPGEILGVAGVAGNGQFLLAETLCGRHPCDEGEVIVDGEPLTREGGFSPDTDAVAYIPEQPAVNGIAGELDLSVNLALKALRRLPFFPDRKAMRESARDLIGRFDVRPPDPDRSAAGLSGGNIQKLVVARELGGKPTYVVACYPTMGLDHGASQAVYETLFRRAAEGACVIWISEDLDDLLAYAHRIAVLSRGRIVGLLPVAEADRERIGLLMTGHAGGGDKTLARAEAAASASHPSAHPFHRLHRFHRFHRSSGVIQLIPKPVVPQALAKAVSFPGARLLISALAFLALGSAFFLLVGQPPLDTFKAMILGAFGDGYSLSESLVKTAPILLCACAAALPARLGLISVGGEGQIYFGALTGTALVLSLPATSPWVMLPAMVLAACVGGALWSSIAMGLKASMGVNETISTLLLNYIASLSVDFLVYGPWKDPNNHGWPATVPFPDAARLPTFFDTRAHVGLVFGVLAALILHVLATHSRWGLSLRVLRSNRKVAEGAGLSFKRQALLVAVVGGSLAGIAGICETSVIQGRLQSGISNGAGFSGFLVAWMAGQHFLRIIPLSLLMGGLLASADTLQMVAGLPSSSSLVLQGLLFAGALCVGGVFARKEAVRV